MKRRKTYEVPSSWLVKLAHLIVGSQYEENFWCHVEGNPVSIEVLLVLFVDVEFQYRGASRYLNPSIPDQLFRL